MFKKYAQIQKSREEGFSLIELLVVIVILGILSTIAFSLYADKQKEAIIAGIKSDVRSLNVATLSYLDKNHSATNLGFVKTSDSAAPTGALASDPLFSNIHPSDSNTSLTLRGTSELIPNGAWNGYVLVGKSTKIIPGQTYSYHYFSVTGKYVESIA